MNPFSPLIFSASAAVILAYAVEIHAGKKKPEEPKRIPGVETVLRISVAELDPYKPGDSYIECVVRNKSDQEITVPTKLVGGHSPSLDLTANSKLIRLHALHLVYWAGPKTEETAKVKPGGEVVAFKQPLKDVLLLDFEAAKKPKAGGEERYTWTWRA